MYIASLASAHAPQAARLHIAGQPDTFLTALGPQVLTTVYRLLPQSRHSYGCAALAGQGSPPQLVGFVAATSGIGRLFGELGTRHLRAVAPPLLHRFLRRPDLVWRSLQTVLYPYLVREPASQASAQARSGFSAELLSIMVLPAQRSRGIGALLLHTLLEMTRQRGAHAIHVTVDAHNLGAQRFYMRHGFARLRVFSLYGRAMCLYQRDLVERESL